MHRHPGLRQGGAFFAFGFAAFCLLASVGCGSAADYVGKRWTEAHSIPGLGGGIVAMLSAEIVSVDGDEATIKLSIHDVKHTGSRVSADLDGDGTSEHHTLATPGSPATFTVPSDTTEFSIWYKHGTTMSGVQRKRVSIHNV